MSFCYHNAEYKVGEFIATKSSEDNIYQIQSIGYKSNDQLHPDLWFSTLVFTKARKFYQKYPGLSRRKVYSSQEFIKEPGKMIFRPKNIKERVTLTPYKHGVATSDDEFFCRFEFKNESLVKYIHMLVHFCDDYIEKG